MNFFGNKKGLVLLIAAVFFLPALSASAEEKETLVIGVENIEYYPLYNYDGEEFTGYARAVLDHFGKTHGYEIEYRPLPVARLFNEFLESETLDFKFPDNPYWSADAKEGKGVEYSDSVVDYIDGVMVKPENTGNELESLATVKGFTAFDYLEQIESGEINLIESTNLKRMLQQVIRGRADGAYTNVVVATYQLRQMDKAGELVFDDSLPHTDSSYYLSTRHRPEVLEEFNDFLEAESEYIEELKQEYKVNAGF